MSEEAGVVERTLEKVEGQMLAVKDSFLDMGDRVRRVEDLLHDFRSRMGEVETKCDTLEKVGPNMKKEVMEQFVAVMTATLTDNMQKVITMMMTPVQAMQIELRAGRV